LLKICALSLSVAPTIPPGVRSECDQHADHDEAEFAEGVLPVEVFTEM
jgi:hypothetical protein